MQNSHGQCYVQSIAFLLEQYSLSPEETLYFEHNIDHVNSALSIGIQAEHYDTDRKDIESLKKFLQANL